MKELIQTLQELEKFYTKNPDQAPTHRGKLSVAQLYGAIAFNIKRGRRDLVKKQVEALLQAHPQDTMVNSIMHWVDFSEHMREQAPPPVDFYQVLPHVLQAQAKAQAIPGDPEESALVWVKAVTSSPKVHAYFRGMKDFDVKYRLADIVAVTVDKWLKAHGADDDSREVKDQIRKFLPAFRKLRR